MGVVWTLEEDVKVVEVSECEVVSVEGKG